MEEKKTDIQLKEDCDRLASLLHEHPQGNQLLLGLQRLSLLQSQCEKPATAQLKTDPAKTSDERKIGIWIAEGDGENPAYIRDSRVDALEAGLWSDCERIPPKTDTKRVVFLGESVARGFFFEPHFSPASVLETILNASGTDPFEVVDLSRSDLGLFGLIQLLNDSLRLMPDCIVIFAGNNWIAYNEAMRSRVDEFSEQIETNQSVYEYKARIQEIILQQIEGLLKNCSQVTRDHQIPVQLILPEFNLADYRSDTRYAQPILTSGQGVEWRRLLRKAEAALEQNDCAAAKPALVAMTEIDRETSAIPLSMLADIAVKENDGDNARMYFEKAKDAEFWHWMNTPRCYGFMLDYLRKAAPNYGVGCVDLPALFSETSEAPLPGRELFFDYCHLTEKGIRLSMAAAAVLVIQALLKRPTSMQDLLTNAPTANKGIVARAYLLAALHNTSWGQPETVIRYQIQEACEADADVFRIVRFWIESAGVPLPPYMTRAFHEAWDTNDLVVLYRLATLGPYLYERFVDAAEPLLVGTQDGPDSAVWQIRERYHDICDQEINLLDSYASIQSWAQPEAFTRDELGFFRAYTLVSRFRFFCSHPASVEGECTVRIPFCNGDNGRIQITCNGCPCVEAEVSSKWMTIRFSVEKENVNAGLNQIELVWLPVLIKPNHELQRVLGNFRNGMRVQFYMPIGDLHSFKARVS